MKYLVTGGTGFIGSNFIKSKNLDSNKFIVLTRDKISAEKKFGNKILFIKSLENLADFEEIDVVINLAGEPIADKKWSSKQKEKLITSRIETTKKLYEFIKNLKQKPKNFISASAIGYYGRNEAYTNISEDFPKGDEFTSELCNAWEYEASKISSLGINAAIIRLGIVLGKNQGALKKMLPAFKFNLGGKLGDGKQIMSWIHIQDVISAIDFIIEKNLSGVFNLTSPNPVSNSEFTEKLAKSLHRFALLNMPSFMVKTIFGEMGEALLLNGQKVLPTNLLKNGFNFRYKKLEDALENIVQKTNL
ncbi:MAG: TIGR01777 family oxidoreductase [Rickettsiales bacterium]|nr:TIGR01777 family oxidoreductase [Rickettsiales bacterium]